MEKCTGKKYCDCAREAMYRGANRDWVDGTEDDCPFRTIPTAKENSAHSFTEGSEVPKEDKPVSSPEPLNVKGATAEGIIIDVLNRSISTDDQIINLDYLDKDFKRSILDAMNEYAQQSRNEAIQECIETIQRLWTHDRKYDNWTGGRANLINELSKLKS